MKAISFAWTLPDLLAGRKTATRRFWKDSYAQRFHARELVAALDKDRRAGGVTVAIIKLTRKPYKQRLADMTEADLEKEGTLWDSLDDFREWMPGDEPWVIEFRVVAVNMDFWPEGRTNPNPNP